MARPLIDFVDADSLKWREMQAPNLNMPFQAKILSSDRATGGFSLLSEYPAGWETTQEGYYDQDEELFYLDGVLEVGGERFVRYSYSFIPRGQLRGKSKTVSGARALAFFNHRPNFTPSDAHGPMYEPERAIPHIHLSQVAWEQPRTPDFPAGAARKTLRWEERIGEGFWIIGLLPQWVSPYVESHTGDEENFVLEGSIETAAGAMQAGSYLVHPAGAEHGPMRSATGCLIITRATLPYATTFQRVDGYGFPPA